jgi:hypothetical protein
MRCLHAGVHECMVGLNGLAQLGWAGLGWVYAAARIRARCEMRDARWRRRTRGEARRGEEGCRGASVSVRDGFVPLAGAGGWVAGLGAVWVDESVLVCGCWEGGSRGVGERREKAGDGCSIHGWVGRGYWRKECGMVGYAMPWRDAVV